MTQGQNGRVLVKCHAGCSTKAILEALQLRECDLFEDQTWNRTVPQKPSPERPAAPQTKQRRKFDTLDAGLEDLIHWRGPYSGFWTYQDAAGSVVGAVVRWDGPEGKDLRPVSKIGDHWEMAAMPRPRPLYRLPDIIREHRVLVVEGEKAAEAGWNLGFPTTTSSNGSQSANQTDWTPLLGKEVIILPDNDKPGMQYARAVTKLAGGGPVVLELPGLPEGGDLDDWAKNEKYAAAKLRKMIIKACYG